MARAEWDRIEADHVSERIEVAHAGPNRKQSIFFEQLEYAVTGHISTCLKMSVREISFESGCR